MSHRTLRGLLLAAFACLVLVGCDDGGSDDVEHGRLTVLVDANVGDGRPAITAPLDARRLAIARDGDVLLAGATSVRRVDARTRTITSVPGTTLDCADGTSIEGPCGANVVAVAVDHAGDIWFAAGDGRIFRVGPEGGEREHVLGRTADHCPEGLPVAGPAAEVCFRAVGDLAFDRAGRLLVADGTGARVLRFDPRSRTVEVVAGDGDVLSLECADDVPATETCIGVPLGIAVDSDGGVLIAAPGLPVRRVDAETGVITRFAGRPEACADHDRRDGGPARDACLWSVSDVAVDGRGDVFIADVWEATIRRVDAETGVIATFAESGFDTLDQALAIDDRGRLVVLGFSPSFVGQTVRRYDRDGQRSVILAGNGYFAYCGDLGPARDACLGHVADVAVGSDGAIYVSDVTSRRVRRIFDGIITTVAGNGQLPPGGERCGDGRAACLDGPGDVAVDGAGTLYVLDGVSDAFALTRVRRVDRTGTTTTVVGGCVVEGDPTTVPAADACLHVAAIAIGPDDDLWVAEADRILRLDAAAGRLVAVAAAPAGCDPSADTQAPECFTVGDLAFDAAGDLFVADGTRVRRIAAGGTTVTTVAGNGTRGDCGDGGLAVDACLVASRVAPDAAGNLFVGGSGVVRRVDAATGIVTHVAGQLDGFCVREPGDRVVPPDSNCATVAAVDGAGRLLYPELSRFAFGRLVRFTP